MFIASVFNLLTRLLLRTTIIYGCIVRVRIIRYFGLSSFYFTISYLGLFSEKQVLTATSGLRTLSAPQLQLLTKIGAAFALFRFWWHSAKQARCFVFGGTGRS